ncbi:hypothetical protein CRV09_01265 [Candidatus Pantoea edessiphila]|uniref:Uncharacterized protein n=1 Tax=Candidatus Pantoea edessiphila TaxID=2044610 RepID=A0A2P5T2X7_9GAMM|nr:hypothetical protein [Candidatus Pantoea edessiphila]PPI88913.1 hypothetical protein CRV09_01265 [Candidatus Pantoea edessiphila]
MLCQKINLFKRLISNKYISINHGSVFLIKRFGIKEGIILSPPLTIHYFLNNIKIIVIRLWIYGI